MSKTIQLTEEQWQALQNGEAVTIEPPKPEKWEPEGGIYYFGAYNTVGSGLISIDAYRLAGKERATKELANRAAKAAKARDRLEAFRDQYWPEWVEYWDGNRKYYYVFYDVGNQCYHIASSYQPGVGTIYGPKEFAVTAVNMLNSGELVL